MNRMSELLFGLSWWMPFAALVAILSIIAEIGFRLARAGQRESSTKRGTEQVSVVMGAILALLGLLLAFTFGMVEARFSARRALVLDEANAIGTTYLRATLLPEPQGANVRALLREYVDVRLTANGPHAIDKAIQRSGKMHTLL